MRPIKFTKKISFQLTVVYVLTLLFSCLTIAILVYSSLTDVVKRNDAESMNRRFADYRFAFHDGGLPELVRLVSYHQSEQPQEKLGVILENESKIIYRTVDPYEMFDSRKIPNGFHIVLKDGEAQPKGIIQSFNVALRKFVLDRGWTELLKFFNFEVIYVYKSHVNPDTQITIFQAFSTNEKDFVRVRMLALSLMSIFIIIGLILGYTLSRRVIVPIRKFITTIDRLEKGASESRVIISEGNEFDLLGDEFNKLMDSKDTLVANINDTLDTVAHEIRTPLTRFRIASEIAISDKASIENREALLREGLEASEHINYLLSTILEASKVRNGSVHLQTSIFSVSELFNELKEIYSFLLEEKNIDLKIEVVDQTLVRADRVLLLQAVNNLLDNAIKFTPQGGRISLEAKDHSDSVEIIVKDSGQGIPQEEQSKVWQRLYRSPRHYGEKGYGIGLSVVRSIVELHRGEISLESQTGKGSTFIIRLFKMAGLSS